MVLADRPFTESETKFLKYIRQWGKKIVFVLNKVDILSSDQEIDEVSNFVADSAKRMLGVDSNKILPVSARSALDVKLRLGGGSMAGALSPFPPPFNPSFCLFFRQFLKLWSSIVSL